ncbi:MAG: hypothetical protein LAQ69_22480 [Acidobacteriia bacterium]|nr:hypothetical protein [Terriglobia bacterium]
MSGLSAIICSRNAGNLEACLDALHRCECGILPIVVDDGLPEGAASGRTMIRVQGKRPFVFARNVNLGIRAAREDDVFLLNDDALVMTQGGVSWMRAAARASERIGVLSAVTNVTGYPEQSIGYRPMRGRVAARVWPTATVAFLGVLIPRRVIDSVGLLDERFVTYGGEDVDYCRRVRRAGLTVSVYDGCFVDHGSLRSTFRPHGGGGDTAEGLRILAEKWGDAEKSVETNLDAADMNVRATMSKEREE